MALFDGVENFTPALTGQQIANQTGAGAASAFTGGMGAGARSKSANSQSGKLPAQFGGNKSMFLKQVQELDGWANDYSNYIHD